jgi:hypothetical protein
MYVSLYLIQINISEPIGTKFCTHLLRGLEETVGYVWAPSISPFPPFRPILSGAGADSCPVDACRRHSAPLLRYIRVLVWRHARWVVQWKRGEVNAMRVCVKMETWWDGMEVTNELNLQLHCSYTNDNVNLSNLRPSFFRFLSTDNTFFHLLNLSRRLARCFANGMTTQCCQPWQSRVCLCRKPLCLYTFFDLLTLFRPFWEMFRERHDNTVIHASHMGNYMLHARESETL